MNLIFIIICIYIQTAYVIHILYLHECTYVQIINFEYLRLFPAEENLSPSATELDCQTM